VATHFSRHKSNNYLNLENSRNIGNPRE